MSNKRKMLFFELILFFLGIPILLLVFQSPVLKIIFLTSGTLYAVIFLYNNRKTSLMNYGKYNRNELVRLGWRVLTACSMILITGWIFQRNHFFRVPYDTFLIPLLMTAYPLISVVPQELIYRVYFFERYEPLFPSVNKLIFADALSFGFMHIIYGNPAAVVLSLAGGLLLSLTFMKTRSFLLTVTEHTFYGFIIFLSGYGQYFMSGNMFKMLFHT